VRSFGTGDDEATWRDKLQYNADLHRHRYHVLAARPVQLGRPGHSKRRPVFVGKRQQQTGVDYADYWDGKRRGPMFVGKRHNPFFVG